MKKWFAGIAVISLLVTAIPVQTEAAVKGEKKLPVLDSKTQKSYIKGTFDSKGRALFYFDAKTYLTGGTHLEFFPDDKEAVTVYESQSDYQQQLVYGRYDQVTNQTLVFPLSWSGRQYIEIEGKRNTSFTVPFKLARLQPLRESIGPSATVKKSTSLVVKMVGPSSQKQRLSEETAAVKHETIDAGLRLEKFTYRTVMQALLAKQQLLKSSNVAYVELDNQMHALGSDVFKSYQWSLNNTGQESGMKGVDINFDAMKKRIAGKKQATVLVAVIDTGINPTYADFTGRVRIDLGYDFVNRRKLAIDDHGHGSHVAGIIAANSNNTFGMSGINAKASIIPIKVLGEEGSGLNSDIAKGILHAVKQKAKVINISIGGGFSSRAIEDALAYAKKKNVLVIVAAGNEGRNKLSYPGRSQYVLSVGSTNRFDRRSNFSNYGSGLDLTAPGQDIPSYLSDGESAFWSGTSMAAPHVAGVASILYSLKPTIKASEVEIILKKSAEDLGKKGYDTSYGYGRLDADRAVRLLK